MITRSVLQDWVMNAPLAMQGTLVLCLRGPDGSPKECLAKDLTRCVRAAILVNAHEKGTPGDDFMGDYSGYAPHNLIEAFRKDHDQYPHHWLMHLIHAAQIIGEYHPSSPVRTFWKVFYEVMCGAFHMNPEVEHQMRFRLRSHTKEEAKL